MPLFFIQKTKKMALSILMALLIFLAIVSLTCGIKMLTVKESKIACYCFVAAVIFALCSVFAHCAKVIDEKNYYIQMHHSERKDF